MRRLGVIGAGLIGRKRARSVEQGVSLCGVYDINVRRAELFQEEFGVPTMESAEALISEAGPGGLIVVAVPNSQLYSSALKAIDGGCHVLLEKPGATSTTEMARILELAEQQNLVVRVGYNHRFHPGLLALKEAVLTQKFGAVQVIRARYGHGGRPGYEKEWRAFKELSGGGELMDQGSHLIDLSRYIIGDIELTTAVLPTLYWNMEVEDNAFIAARGRTSDTVLWLHASWTEWKNIFSFEVFCQTAKLEVTGLGGSYGPESFTVFEMEAGLGIPTQVTQTFVPNDESWSREMTDIWAHIDGGSVPAGATGRDGLEALQVMEEAYDS